MNDLLDKIKSTVLISKFISGFLVLKKSGNDRFKTCCPFHKEKTPSFHIDDRRGMYKCFGCGESGDIISFVQKHENLDFKESLEYIAQICNIEYTKYNNISNEYNIKTIMVQMNKIALEFFQKSINSKVGIYLNRRKILDEKSKYFNIGYAADSYNNLLTLLKENNFSDSEIMESGLIGKSENGKMYSVFRDRIMIPIFDIQGNVIGFGGRSLDDKIQPKYLNSRDSLIFKKGELLYNIHNAKKIHSDLCLVVEGYMDVISLYDINIPVVATLGTAISENQINLLSRYWKNAVFWLDSDKAGINATMRIIQIILQMEKCEINIKFVMQKSVKDPDEYFNKYGKSAVLNEINQAMPMHEFIWLYFSQAVNFQDPQDLISLQQKIDDFIKIIVNKMIKKEYASYFKNMIYKAKFVHRAKKDSILKIQNNNLSKLDIIEGLMIYILVNKPDLLELDLNISFNNKNLADVFEKIIINEIEEIDITSEIFENIPIETIDLCGNIQNQFEKLMILRNIEILELEFQKLLQNGDISGKMNALIKEKQKLLQSVKDKDILS